MKKYMENNNKENEKALKEAVGWVTRFEEDKISSRMYSRFQKWLHGNPIRKNKFDLMADIWDSSDVLKENPLVMADIKESINRQQTRSQKEPLINRLMGNLWYKPLAAAVSVMLIITVIWFAGVDTPTPENIRTTTGELKSLFLEDGSLLRLDAETIVTIKFSKALRQVNLKQGRIFVSVKHDKNRLFIVNSGTVQVRALGTEFNVAKEKRGDVSVTVTKGRVLVSSEKETRPMDIEQPEVIAAQKDALGSKALARKVRSPQSPLKEVLGSGQAIMVSEKKTAYVIQPVEIDVANSWQKGRLVFHDKPLGYVIEEINRYLDNKIVINDKQLEDLRLSLDFKIKHRDKFLEALKMTIPVKTRTTLDGQIILLRS